MAVGWRGRPWGFGRRAVRLRGRGYARPRIVRPAPARRQGWGHRAAVRTAANAPFVRAYALPALGI